MLPIHINAPSRWKEQNNVNSPTENWNVGYTDNDLLTNHSAGNGARCWCQECERDRNIRVFRGNYYPDSAGGMNSNVVSIYNGWRPVLELVD